PTSWDPRQGPRFEDYAPYVTSLALTDSTVFVGGPFYSIGEQERYFVAEVDRRTGTATPWNPRADGAPEALAVDAHTVYAGGLFHTLGEWQWRRNLAAFDATTGRLKEWNPNPDGLIVYDLAVHADRVYAAGHFYTIG